LKDGKINFRTWRGPAWATDKKVSDGKWHHIALVVKDGARQTAYVDGSQVGKHDYDHSDFDWQKGFGSGFPMMQRLITSKVLLMKWFTWMYR